MAFVDSAISGRCIKNEIAFLASYELVWLRYAVVLLDLVIGSCLTNTGSSKD